MASGITDAVIEDVKSRIDIADLIASYGVALKRSGASVVACCPFHNEKTPSFNINRTKGFYHCFGCGESGDAIKFVMKREGMSFVEAVKKLASQCGVEIVEKADPEAKLRMRLFALMAELAQFYRRCLLKTKEAQVARDYLAGRDLDGAIAEEFLIGYAPNGAAPILTWAEKHGFTLDELAAAGVVKPPSGPGDRPYHRFGGRLMFPVNDRRGRVVAFSGRILDGRKNTGKYVNSPTTPIFSKSRVLFGFDRASGAIASAVPREAICCEGQIDTIRLHSCGFRNAIATQGTAFTTEHARAIKRVADSAVLMYDDDQAGRAATVKVAKMLLAMEMPVRTVSLPDGDDPDSFLRTHGSEKLRALIDGAESIVAFQTRAERAKERNPGAIDAVDRVSKAVLATIAECPSAILRATLSAEAARLLSLPVAAVDEELGKMVASAKSRPAARPAAPEPEDDGAEGGETRDPAAPAPDDGGPFPEAEDAAEAVPPPPRETAFMGFLLANEGDAALAASVARLLPEGVFARGFTKDFLARWLEEAEKGEDTLAAFADSLPPKRRGWFDRALSESAAYGANALPPEATLRDFARSLWCDALARERGALPAAGDEGADARRMEISLDMKRFRLSGWDAVEKMINEKTEDGRWTSKRPSLG